jgi:tripartite-type tricarboxylate transporter receptor subunit TctC
MRMKNEGGIMKEFARQTIQGLMVAATFFLAITLSETTIVLAQDYPNRDITFIIPWNPGGSSDPIARQFATQLAKVLSGKVSVNVENKPGGSGSIGVGAILRAKPDGYTIGLGPVNTLVYQPLVNSSLSWKTPDDYQPITKLADVPYVLAVRAEAPWKTFAEFMADVRKNPGKIRAAVSGMRTGPDMVMQLLNKVAGVKVTTAPFTGGAGEALIALLGGRVEAYASTGISIVGQVQAGKVRVLAVFQKDKYELFPNATPVVDATISSVDYAIAPTGIPKDVLAKLIDASLRAVRSEGFNQFAKANGYGPDPDPKGPEAVRAELLPQTKLYSDLIKFIEQ